MTVQNSIEREMVLKAEINDVWDAITNPDKLSQWFGDHADIVKLAEGEPIVFRWEDDICKGVIHTVNKPTVFAFRWQSSRLGKSATFQEAYSTLVTFTLTSVLTGTHLHLLETGFASLPETITDKPVEVGSVPEVELSHSEQSYQDNVSGWTYELDELKAFIEQDK